MIWCKYMYMKGARSCARPLYSNISTDRKIIQLLLLIYGFKFRSAFLYYVSTMPSQPRPLPLPTHL